MTNEIPVAGISGSLRESSYNTATLRAVKELSKGRLNVDIITLEDIPLFNEDVEAKGWPEKVQQLRDRVEPAKAVIFATPEYNYSIPGVLKNAIDWLSRPERKGPIFNKPATIIGATPSMIGTARAQAHLRQVAFYNGMPLLPTAEILIAKAGDKFTDDGELNDEETKSFLKKMIDEFAPWVREHL